MNRRTLGGLAVVVAVLIAMLIVLELGGDQGSSQSGDLLLPDFAGQANAVTRVEIQRNGAGTESLVIEKSGDAWRVPARDNYPASLAKVREILRALAEMKILEAKTANPDLHERLGLRDPDIEGSKGIRLTASGESFSTAVIFGNTAQGSYRYARLADTDQTFLVDRNPSIPAEVSDWLLRSLLDIDSSAVRSVRIEHPDGEVIPISKENADDSNFAVADIPEGRELSYSTVANGIGGALNDLSLDDVRKAPADAAPGSEPVTTTFETFDDRRVIVRTYEDDGASWIAIDLEATADGSIDDALRERLAGWQFTVADYKANLFKRRFEDILKPLPEAE